jgi:hypothetical protein
MNWVVMVYLLMFPVVKSWKACQDSQSVGQDLNPRSIIWWAGGSFNDAATKYRLFTARK